MPGDLPLIWPKFERPRDPDRAYQCDRCRLPMSGLPAIRLFVHYVGGETVQWELCGLCAESLSWWKGPIDKGGNL